MSAKQTGFPKLQVPGRSINQSVVLVGKNGLPVDALAILEPGVTVVSANSAITYSSGVVTVNASVDLSPITTYVNPRYTGTFLFTDKLKNHYFVDPATVNNTSHQFNIYLNSDLTGTPSSISLAPGWSVSEAALVNRLETTSSAIIDTVEFKDVQVKIDLEDAAVFIKDEDGDQLEINEDGSTNTVVIESVLPDGAATEAKQDVGNTSLASIDTKLTNGTQKSQITDGVDTVGISTIGLEKALKVDMINFTPPAGGGGTYMQDKTNFVEGTNLFTPTGGVRNDTLDEDVDEDEGAAARITPKRALHVNWRDNDGEEVGTVTNPAHVTVDNINDTSNLLIFRDTVNNLTYVGTAAIGSETDQPVWRIVRVERQLTANNDQEDEITLIAGTGDFDQIWDDRDTLFPAATNVDFFDRRFERLLPILTNANWLKLGDFDHVSPTFNADSIEMDYFQNSALIAKATVLYEDELNWDISLEAYVNDDNGDLLQDDDDSNLLLD